MNKLKFIAHCFFGIMAIISLLATISAIFQTTNINTDTAFIFGSVNSVSYTILFLITKR